jgi:hypothetical protein
MVSRLEFPGGFRWAPIKWLPWLLAWGQNGVSIFFIALIGPSLSSFASKTNWLATVLFMTKRPLKKAEVD